MSVASLKSSTTKKVKLGKKEVAELTGVGRKPTTKIVTKESDWESYYGSNNISFVVPANATIGIYDVIAVNNYTGNFGSHINNFYNSNLNYSNSISYILT